VKSTIFWDVTPCSLMEVHRCFGGRYCFQIQGRRVDQASYSTFLRNVGKHLRNYTLSHRRREYSSLSPLWEPQLSQPRNRSIHTREKVKWSEFMTSVAARHVYHCLGFTEVGGRLPMRDEVAFGPLSSLLLSVGVSLRRTEWRAGQLLRAYICWNRNVMPENIHCTWSRERKTKTFRITARLHKMLALCFWRYYFQDGCSSLEFHDLRVGKTAVRDLSFSRHVHMKIIKFLDMTPCSFVDRMILLFIVTAMGFYPVAIVIQ
jgi:hypothetical protein